MLSSKLLIAADRPPAAADPWNDPPRTRDVPPRFINAILSVPLITVTLTLINVAFEFWLATPTPVPVKLTLTVTSRMTGDPPAFKTPPPTSIPPDTREVIWLSVGETSVVLIAVVIDDPPVFSTVKKRTSA